MRSSTSSRATPALLAFAMVLLVGLAVVARAPADSLQEKLDRKQERLEGIDSKKQLLTTEVSRYNDQIDQLTGEVAALRNREAVVQADLDTAQSQLDEAQHDLKLLRERLRRSIDSLEDRLVEIYKDDEPDAMTAILEADGYDDALSRYEYLQRIQDRNSDIVGRVRELRDDTAATVERVLGLLTRGVELRLPGFEVLPCAAELLPLGADGVAGRADLLDGVGQQRQPAQREVLAFGRDDHTVRTRQSIDGEQPQRRLAVDQHVVVSVQHRVQRPGQ